MALKLADEARRINPASARVAITRGRALLANDDPDGAIEALERVVERSPRAPEVLLELAVAHQRAGDEPRAEAAFRRRSGPSNRHREGPLTT